MICLPVRLIFVTLALSGAVFGPAHALDPARSIEQMYHRAYTREVGAPPGVMAIAQTPDGYLWLATQRGLYRFDGVGFEQFAPDELLSLDVRELTTTKAGDLWIGYLAGGVSRLHDGVFTHYPAGEGGPTGLVEGLGETSNAGVIWAIAEGRPWRFAGDAWIEESGDWSEGWSSGGGLWAFQIGRDGTVWGKDGEALYYWDAQKGRFLQAPGYAGGLMGFARDSDGRIWTSDTNDPWRMYALPDRAGFTGQVFPEPEYQGRISERIRGRIFFDRDGTLWNINPQNGLLRIRAIAHDNIEPNAPEAFNEKLGLTSNLVTNFFEDQEGNVWVATSSGLDLFRPANVVVERRIPATSAWYSYMAVRSGDALYVHAPDSVENSSPDAMNRGPIFRIDSDGSFEKLVEDAEIGWLAARRNGGVWIGTYDDIMMLQDGLIPTPGPPRSQFRILWAVQEDDAGVLWAANSRDGVWRRVNGEWSRAPLRLDWRDAFQVAIERDENGVWLSYLDDDAVFRVTPDGPEEFSGATGPGVGLVQVIYRSSAGVLFGGETGIALYADGAFRTVGGDRLPELVAVSGIAESAGYLWIGAQAGVLRFDAAELFRAMQDSSAPPPHYELFDALDGVPGELTSASSASINRLITGPDGRVWIITDNGVAWIDPNNIHHNQMPPPVAIRSVVANQQTITSPAALTLPAGTSSLEIDYAAFSFTEPSRVQFRYKLEGVDRNWVDPGRRRQAFYTRLGAGTHRFHVIASNDAGVWNEKGATLVFTIPPTFLQSIWFKFMLALALAGLIWFVYAWRLRSETARLQSRFEVRIAERERIARELHDTLLQGFQGLLLRFQAVANRAPADSEFRHAVDEALDRADAVLVEGRSRVRELRRASVQGDLACAIVAAADDCIAGETPRFFLTVEGEPRMLHALVSEETQRIAEEAIRNAVQHAHARKLEVLLSYGRDLRLVIRDDGRGLPAAVLASGEKRGHFGLVGMRERAEQMDGRLDIASREGVGAEITLTVPGAAAYADQPAPWRIFRRLKQDKPKP